MNPKGDPDFTIAPLWFWNDLITDKKTSEQFNMMGRINARQPIIHSRMGLINEYLSDDWFAKVGHVIKQAKKTI